MTTANNRHQPKKQRARLAHTCALYKIASDAALCCQLTCAYNGVGLFSLPAHTARNKVTCWKNQTNTRPDNKVAADERRKQNKTKKKKKTKTKNLLFYFLDYVILCILIRINLSYLSKVNLIWNEKRKWIISPYYVELSKIVTLWPTVNNWK